MNLFEIMDELRRACPIKCDVMLVNQEDTKDIIIFKAVFKAGADWHHYNFRITRIEYEQSAAPYARIDYEIGLMKKELKDYIDKVRMGMQ